MIVRAGTQDWSRAERVERWRETFGRQVVRADVVAAGPRPDRFAVDLSLMPGTRLDMLRMRLTSVRKVRDARLIADGADTATLMIPLAGAVRYDTAEHREVLRPGQAALFSHRVPIALDWHDATILTLQLAEPELAAAGPLRPVVGRPLDCGRGAAALLRAYAVAVWQGGELSAMAERHLGELVLASLAAPAAPGEGRASRALSLRAAQLARLRTLLARVSARTDLTVDVFAGLAGVSARTVQRLFRDAGTTFGDALLEQRLQASHARLSGAGPLRISEVAFEAGFADLSHFNHRFKQRFGQTPSEVRLALAGTRP